MTTKHKRNLPYHYSQEELKEFAVEMAQLI